MDFEGIRKQLQRIYDETGVVLTSPGPHYCLLLTDKDGKRLESDHWTIVFDASTEKYVIEK